MACRVRARCVVFGSTKLHGPFRSSSCIIITTPLVWLREIKVARRAAGGLGGGVGQQNRWTCQWCTVVASGHPGRPVNRVTSTRRPSVVATTTFPPFRILIID